MKDYIYNKTKELLRFVVYILLPLTGGGWMGVSCSDMLEADSSRQLFEPGLNEKTDSVFYAYGIMQAMQQVADQYYFQNELRGDLVKTTDKATTHLRSLAAFKADASNKYDSVYLYYKVINNCNYYLAHRDSTLRTGKQNVVINEYAAVASFRAWSYLQLSRQYGEVPYITEPVTTIGQINSSTAMTPWETILAGEAQMLENLKSHYTDEELSVPTFNRTTAVNIGTLNRGGDKLIYPSKCFVPLNVVLGDIYLELGQYDKAAKCYYDYLRYNGQLEAGSISVNYTTALSTSFSQYSPIFKNFTEWPVDYNYTKNATLGGPNWLNSFFHAAAPGDVISYIPMAVNYTTGKTTDVPAAFGYDYYTTTSGSDVSLDNSYTVPFNCPRTENIQVVPSQSYCDSARTATYYYYGDVLSIAPYWDMKSVRLGDARARLVAQGTGADSTYVYCYKPSTAYILLYRNATVWLHLAEALNRMGYPDAAFAVLKNGLNNDLRNRYYYEVYQKDADGNFILDDDQNKVLDANLSHVDPDRHYLAPATYELLTTTLPFASDENSEIFKSAYIVGIHYHGAGACQDPYSLYRYRSVVGEKLADINAKFGLNLTQYTKQDSINAMEDLLCDEYAMEFAFEGTRFSDLRRLANHKNAAGLYGGNFGDAWLSRMLQNNAAGITTKNCYLPYK